MKTKEQKIILSFLFLKGKNGATIKEIKSIFNFTESKIKEHVENIKKELIESDSPLDIKWSEDKIRLTISNKASILLSKKMNKTINIKLSKPVMETLTIVAYKQPLTKPEIERIRGVSSDYAIAKLIEFELIKDVGSSDLPGRPRIYQTTPEFLELFDLKSLSELPPIPEEFENQDIEQTELFDYGD